MRPKLEESKKDDGEGSAPVADVQAPDALLVVDEDDP